MPRLPARKDARGQAGPRIARAAKSFAALEHAHRRLKHLYEITKLLASFENVEQTFEPLLGIVTTSKTFFWRPSGRYICADLA